MHKVEPKVFLVAETQVNYEGLTGYLAHIGASQWANNAPSGGELLTEVMGRLCYKSFEPGLNKNVTRIREGNEEHLGNMISVGHGSVFEHASVSFIFSDVSRVFTHELVRHRAGTAISQESLRFVRLTDLGQWLPTVIRENGDAAKMFTEIFYHLETLQKDLADIFELDKEGVPFSVKKTITSAMRRLAPIGLATTIGWTANFRTLRWVLENRTSPHAEEEIRFVFQKVGEIVLDKYPNIFYDFSVTEDGWYKPVNSKI